MLSSLRTKKDSKMTEAKRKVGRRQSLRSQPDGQRGGEGGELERLENRLLAGVGGLGGGGGGGWRIPEI